MSDKNVAQETLVFEDIKFIEIFAGFVV